jgi:hypothetical protein
MSSPLQAAVRPAAYAVSFNSACGAQATHYAIGQLCNGRPEPLDAVAANAVVRSIIPCSHGTPNEVPTSVVSGALPSSHCILTLSSVLMLLLEIREVCPVSALDAHYIQTRPCVGAVTFLATPDAFTAVRAGAGECRSASIGKDRCESCAVQSGRAALASGRDRAAAPKLSLCEP